MEFKKIYSGIFGSGDLSDHHDYRQTKTELAIRGFVFQTKGDCEFAEYADGNPKSDATYMCMLPK